MVAEPEVVSSEIAYGALVKAEVDKQIETAKRWPRDIEKFKRGLFAMATATEEIAAACCYSLPRGGKDIEGPSVRLAEIAVNNWGNLRAAARVIGIDDKHVTCQGMCHDLETNVAVSVEVKRRITDRNGRRYNEDMIVVTANAGCAIAFRNAAFKVIPAALINPVYIECRKIMADETGLEAKRLQAVRYYEDKGVPRERIFAKIGVTSIEAMTGEHVGLLRGLVTALNNGDTTLEESFPKVKTDGKLDEGKRKAGKDAGAKNPDAPPASATKQENLL